MKDRTATSSPTRLSPLTALPPPTTHPTIVSTTAPHTTVRGINNHSYHPRRHEDHKNSTSIAERSIPSSSPSSPSLSPASRPHYLSSQRPLGGGAVPRVTTERSRSPPSRTQPLRALSNEHRTTTTSTRNPVGSDPLRSTGGLTTSPYTVGFPVGNDHRGSPERWQGGRGPGPDAGAGGGNWGGSGIARDRAGIETPLPRVADIEGVHRAALARQKAKAAEAAALVKPCARGRKALYYPSWYDPAKADSTAPDSALELEYVHGYTGETPARGAGVAGAGGGRVGGARQAATRSTNVVWLRTGEIVFPASAVVVLHDFEANRQRFFTGHDEASVHTNGFRERDASRVR